MTLGPKQAAALLKQATALHIKGRVAEAAAPFQGADSGHGFRLEARAEFDLRQEFN